MTDGIVWSFCFEEIGLPLQLLHGNSLVHVTFPEVAVLLPRVRCYQPVDELGYDYYKLQGYFLTHFLYVASGWGR
jgi:hypothetical protein